MEAYGGEVSQIAALFTQLEQMGVFKQVEGIILGTFTAYEKSGATQRVFDLLTGHIPETLPVAKTTEIGHGTDSRLCFCLMLVCLLIVPHYTVASTGATNTEGGMYVVKRLAASSASLFMLLRTGCTSQMA